jgi:hypothetical protein
MLPWSSVLGAIARVANDGEQVNLCRMRVQHVVFDVGLPIRPMLNTLWGNAVAAPRTFSVPPIGRQSIQIIRQIAMCVMTLAKAVRCDCGLARCHKESPLSNGVH